MDFPRLILIISILWINGCSVHHRPRTPERTGLFNIYAKSSVDAQHDVAKYVEERLKEQKTFGYVKPYVPVINEPVVRKVWVPDHKAENNPDVMVAGHWVYLMIQPPSWFIDGHLADAKFPVIIPTEPQLSKGEVKHNEYEHKPIADNF